MANKVLHKKNLTVLEEVIIFSHDEYEHYPYKIKINPEFMLFLDIYLIEIL